jgi:hypothetical protein
MACEQHAAMRVLPFVVLLAACTIDDPESTFDTDAARGPMVYIGPPPAGGVAFGRDTSERIYGVHIRDQAHRQPRVVYSVRLDDVRADEKLLLRGEVVLSRCNRKDIAGESGDAKNTPCDSKDMVRDPYGYTPRFSAAFVIAGSPTDATGTRVSGWFDRNCTEGQHHCALALPEVTVGDPPAAAERYVNLVVSADAQDHDARSWDVMEVEQDKGALAVTRVAAGGGGHAIVKRSEQLLAAGSLGIDRPEEDGDPTQVRHRLYRLQLSGLHGGDVIDADARMRAVLGNGFTCDPLITAEVIVTADPQARDPKGPHDERITVKNGANCADHSNDGCKYEESGAVRLKHGAPDTMYVSYLATALRSCAAPDGSDSWKARASDGFLEVHVRR